MSRLSPGTCTPPRICLLHDAPAAGGVATVTRALVEGLRAAGWPVDIQHAAPQRGPALLAAARRSDVLLAAHNFRPAYVAWALGLATRRRAVVWVHGPVDTVLEQARAGAGKQAWLRWLYGHVSHCVFVSGSSQAAFLRFIRGGSRKSPALRVVHNPAPPSCAAAQPAQATERHGPVRMGYMGRLSAEKNPQLLLETLRRLPPEFHLSLAGDGPLRSALEAASQDLQQAGRLRWLGHVEDSAGFCREQDLTLLTSRYEGCPMAALESLSMGVPCVGVPIPALQEMLQGHAPYLLARENSAQAMADAVLATLRTPAEIVQADLQRILEQYRHADFLAGWQSVLREASGRC
ncbi:glycosyltransferase [Paracidovorax avenae]|uniref:glycosyltransferase n=1 Tax=Paracidovorax avenae TaxID=80867 RepID=UPI001CEF8814|nr:glycosyltransferase [Paracidovorax avenae]